VRIAITGGTGFVGRHLAAGLIASGHEVVAIGRGVATVPAALPPAACLEHADITDVAALTRAFAGCAAVAHCAGINREIGPQTFDRVHVKGTLAVIEAAREAGIQRLALLSFLRAQADGPSAYHRSKWAAEELVRRSGLSFTVLKAGVIHGRGDHMLDHLSRAFHTFPVFALVGLRDRPIRPVAVADVTRLLEAAVTGDPRLVGRTLVVVGPEELPLGEAIRRVARVAGRRPLFVRLPVGAHMVVGWCAEMLMRVPLISRAQVRILAEGVTRASPHAEAPPPDLAPATPFSDEVIRAGLPSPGGFGRADLRWLRG
jgi:uncharacterized protein YbjT (DUF2867 family)